MVCFVWNRNHYKLEAYQVMSTLCDNMTQLSLSNKIRVLNDFKHYHRNIKVYGLQRYFGNMGYNIYFGNMDYNNES